MAKYLSVYLNDSEVEMLQNLQQVLGIGAESGVLKAGLKHLGNDHMHGEPEPGRLESDLRIEIPAGVRLRALCRECYKEVREEKPKSPSLHEIYKGLWG